MIGKRSVEKNSATKQIDLLGDVISEKVEVLDDEESQILKSVLQKAVRRGMVEKAMYAAYRLSNKRTGWILWRRLTIISAEDVLDSNVITAIDVLRKEAKEFGYESWDGRRCAVAAALLMVESKKDRRADEFLELMEAMNKHSDRISELAEVKKELESIPDEALDMHTTRGRKMGRGERYWYEVSSETENKKEAYVKWREWWRPIILKTIEERKASPNKVKPIGVDSSDDLQPEGSSKN